MPVTLPSGRPPADQSGGIMSVRFQQNGETKYIQHVHLFQFDTANDYTSAITGSSETNIAATFAAYATIIQYLYDASWIMQLTAVTRNVGGVPTRQAPPVGTGGAWLQHSGVNTNTAAEEQNLTQTILEYWTLSGDKGRLRFIGVNGTQPQVDEPLVAANPTLSATSPVGDVLSKLTQYLTTVSAIRAHDGSAFTLPGHVLYTWVAKNRRKSLRVV